MLYRPKTRGHGCKDDMKGKFHISRLAKDVHDFIQWLKKKQICVQKSTVFIRWDVDGMHYMEFRRTIWRERGEKLHICGSSTIAEHARRLVLRFHGMFRRSVAENLQRAVLKGPDLSEFADGNERACLAEGSSFKCEKEVKECTMGCKPEALAELMADHTNLDWRPLVGSLEAGARGRWREYAIFPWKGVAYVGFFDEQRANYGL